MHGRNCKQQGGPIRMVVVVSVMAILGMGVSYAGDKFLSGKKKTACEVLLCLSSGERPKECKKPIKKYIKSTLVPGKPWKTIKKRKKFLKLCPSGNYDGKTSHIEVLAEGAETCEMDHLLVDLNVSDPPYSKDLPEACESFVAHQYTTGFALPVRTERCSDAHVADLGPMVVPITEHDYFSLDVVVVNQAEIDEWMRKKRLQAFQPTPMCVSRWSDPATPAPARELDALLAGEITRVEEASEAQYVEDNGLVVADHESQKED